MMCTLGGLPVWKTALMHVQVLQPAIELAENGFPVSPVTACVCHPFTPLPAQTLLCIMMCTCLTHIQYHVWII